MTILTGIVALIVQAGSGLEAITASRLFPISLPESFGAQLATAPAMTYQIVGGNSQPGLTNAGPQRMRIQFDCYGTTYKAAYMVRKALIDLLNQFSGALPNGAILSSSQFIQPIDFAFQNDARQFRLGAEFYLRSNLTS